MGLPPLLPRDARDAVAAAARRLQGDYEEDAWGYDPEFVRLLAPALDALFTRVWRVAVAGAEHLPERGPALVVANQGGALPWDGAMVATAIRRAGAREDPRLLLGAGAFDVPWAGVALRRAGAVAPTPVNALGLLREGHVVVAFPEGGRGEGDGPLGRYRLRRFGRGEVVEVALRAGAPVIPCAVVAPAVPLVGALGLLPLPARWRVSFGTPLSLPHPPGAAADRALVLELSDHVRDAVQQAVYDTLVER
jgi:1-acyl-sn-glycerol-3-phosphate acyltransferase